MRVGQSIDWDEAMNPGRNRSKRMYDNCRLEFVTEWIDDRTKAKPNGGFEQKKKMICVVHNPVTADRTAVPIDALFLEQYSAELKAYEEGAPLPVSGTPLVQWSAMPRAIYEEVNRMGFETLEQIAEEGAKAKLGPLQMWGKKAKEALKAEGANPARVAAAIERAERAEEKCARYEDQISQMQRRIEQAGV